MDVHTINPDYGFAIAVFLAFWVQQSIIFVIPVATQRGATKIKAPTLYPRDSEIKDLKLTESQVEKYMCAQRVHQQNVEFLVVFLPLYILAALFKPREAAIAGAIVWLGRLVTALGYWYSPGARSYGGWFHVPELYIVYLVGQLAYTLVVRALAKS